MQFDILTIFPNSFSYIEESIIGKAKQKGLININVHNIRDCATDKHKTTDDKPFGGGPGMLMKIEPIYRKLKEIGAYPKKPDTLIILTSAGGKSWNQSMARNFKNKYSRIVLICGRYEGVDQRVAEHLADIEISIGNYVLSGGELASLVILDSISRLVDGVLGSQESLKEESNEKEILAEYPQYTRPSIFKTEEGESWNVPDVLIAGDHKKIAEWKKNKTR